MVADGKPSTEAYRKIYKSKAAAAESNSCRLMGNDKVAARINELKTATAELCRLSRRDLAAFCADIITTPLAKVNARSALCQEETTTRDGSKFTRKIKMPSKLDAVDKLAKLCGYYAPEKHAHEFDTVEDFLHKFTHGKE